MTSRLVQPRLPERARWFTCCGCGKRMAPGTWVPLVGILVVRPRLRSARAAGADGERLECTWNRVPVQATDRYPARCCAACATAWPHLHKPARRGRR